MKFLFVALSVLVTAVVSKITPNEDAIDLENNSAYGYLARVGVPLANKIREAETRSIKNKAHRTAVKPALKISSGRAARLGQFPYQAGLIGEKGTNISICGGSLLNKRRVITAAHCWWDGEYQVESFTVVLGSVMLFYGGNRIRTSKVIIHSLYDYEHAINDIAMVYLTRDVQFSDTIQPIALPTGSQLLETFEDSEVTALGFGDTIYDEDITIYQRLRYASLRVITNDQCSRDLRHVLGNVVVSSHICTKGPYKRDTCMGDSGGPITVFRKKRPILIGLVSFGVRRGCKTGSPNVYTRVTSYINWIKKQL